MEPGRSGHVTAILKRLSKGDASAADELMPIVYRELRALASSYLRRERRDHTLQATALVNEAYLRLVGLGPLDFAGRAHFFAVAANIMRRILIDHARQRLAEKRGHGAAHLELQENLMISDQNCARLIDVDQALERLGKLDQRQARVVELRYFAGMTEEEIGLLLGVSSRTVKRDWLSAKAWLKAELGGGQADLAQV
jgi:RNA polymerase sigma factor (TIGR02999 family)